MNTTLVAGLEEHNEHAEDLLDEALEESFPASDPPSHSGGRGRASTSPEPFVGSEDV